MTRQDALSNIETITCMFDNGSFWYDGVGCESLVNDIYDGIGVCVECKHCTDIEKSYKRCEELGINVVDDFYCKSFERGGLS